jgi:hypothetical protein
MTKEELEKQTMEWKNNYILKLEKENAELKVSCKIQVDTAFQMIEEKDEQLTKAKVALRNVIDYLGQFCSDYPDCVIEAEKILKKE